MGSGVRWALAMAASSVGAVLGAERAVAGAWTQEPGKGIQITNVSRETGEFGEAWRSDAYMEGGFKGNWGLSLKVQSEIRLGDYDDDRTSVEAGVRKSFALTDRSVISVQASYLTSEATIGPECVGDGYEVRGAWGSSTSFGSGTAFVNVESGWRARGDCGRAVSEIAAGADLAYGFRVLGKVYSEEGDGAKSAKAEAMLYFDHEKYSYGAGYRQEVSGAFEEKGWVVSVWRRF